MRACVLIANFILSYLTVVKDFQKADTALQLLLWKASLSVVNFGVTAGLDGNAIDFDAEMETAASSSTLEEVFHQ